MYILLVVILKWYIIELVALELCTSDSFIISEVKIMKNGNAALYILIGIASLTLIAYLIVKNNQGDTNKDEVTTNEEVATETETDTESNPVVEEIEEEIVDERTIEAADKSVVENALGTGSHATLMSALDAAALSETLKGDGPFTVFGPTDTAFNNLPEGTLVELLKPENKTDLVGILTYHIVPGEYTSSELTDGLQLETVNGQLLTFSMKDGVWWINNTSKITSANVISNNGVLYSIDTVLLPMN